MMKGNWINALNAARNTVSKEQTNKEPSGEWKRKILLAEHSPIRLVKIFYTWETIKSWISVHLTRHKIGAEHFVSTQRDDRTNIDRDKASQDTLVSHSIEANAQAIINISRKRLCYQSHKETREVWGKLLDDLKRQEPELYSVCVPECIYRGFCPELKPCGYASSKDFDIELKKYRNKESY
jgi:hypothetical protein